MSWIAVGGAAISGVSSVMSGKSASKKAEKQQRVATNLANQSFTPINVTGPGGAGVTFGGGTTGGFEGAGGQGDGTRGELVYNGSKGTFYSDGFGGRMTKEGLQVVPGTRGKVIRSDIGNASLSAGDLEGLRAGLVGQATASQAQGAGLDQNTLGLLANLQGAYGQFGDAGLQGLGNLQQLTNSGVGLSAMGLADASDFAGQLRGQAQNAFGSLPGTQQQSTAETLGLLRQQAQPFEERAFSNLQDNLFATGRLGTTGGGLQTEAFARGLGQADLSRQLAASTEGRAAQEAQLGLGQGLSQEQDSLMTNAMNRFEGMTGLSRDLGQSRFDRTSKIADDNFKRAGDLLTAAPQFLQQQLERDQLSNIGQGLQNVGDINQNALNQAQFAQQLMGQQAASRQGAAAMVPGQTPDMSTANMLGQISSGFGGLTDGKGVMDGLKGLFGGGGGGNSPKPLNEFGFRGNPAG